ncbi:unnamed protein product [Thelazia callipaeda]|uniref:Protein RIC1 homolog n=1 Tax=Thelazia callipaeda TaxID=103827 RepID=A0A158RB57_THECL|nr:unnamed protein product [Thelazia callipaeda]
MVIFALLSYAFKKTSGSWEKNLPALSIINFPLPCFCIDIFVTFKFKSDGSEHSLRLPGCSKSSENYKPRVHCVVGNRDKTLFIAVTSSIFYIYLAHPQLLLCTFKRSEEDTKKKGEYRKVYWRNDSTAICFTTSKNCLLLYGLDISYDKQSFTFTEPLEVHLRRTSSELFIKEKRPQIAAYLSVVARLYSTSTCIVPFRDDLFVCLQDGWLHRISWEGIVDKTFSFNLLDIPFAVDQLQSKTEYVQESGAHVVDMAYAPLIGGFSIVLSNGTAALLTSPSSKFLPKDLLGVWALHLNDGVCTTVNHKYRLIVYGCKNGDIAVFHLEDGNGSLTCTYRIALEVKNGPELLNRMGEVRHVECHTQGTALTAVWSPLLRDKREGDSSTLPIVAIFSSFGAQLWCSLESSSDRDFHAANSYQWVDWGPEGFSLWLATDVGLHVLPIAHSVNSNGIESTERIIFLSDKHIYLSAAKEREQNISAPHSIWHVLPIPSSYLSSNWPIRLVEMDDCGQWLAVAGSRGFIHHNLAACKWRMFGNESQERDMFVTGGMTICYEHVVLACYDTDRCKEELRFYPLENQLNDQFCIKHPVSSRILLLTRRHNKLITFDIDSCIFIFTIFLEKNHKNKEQVIRLDRCVEIRVQDLVPHAACVLSVELAALNHDSPVKFCDGVDTVLLNVCGRLIMVNPVKRDGVVSNLSDSEDDQDDETYFQLSQPILIASYVENIWHEVAMNSTFERKPHLTHALWLNCGVKGMKVWIPLFTSERDSSAKFDSYHTFISKRIMLPFELDVTPLVICSRDCLAIGMESCPAYSDKTDCRKHLPVYNLHRKSEVFLHHLLRQLLKRNLGVYALEIAATCNQLPYFGHVLELLLHNVLEEEATSSDPIPDPLLPRVVAFIQKFPNYLQTIAHCARKTELALWHALFAVTGHPRDLFEKCINDGQLETAVSFLIILQNMESVSASQEHATILLEETLSKRKWLTARDIVRFLRAIDPSDTNYPLRTPCSKPHRNVASVMSRISTRRSTNDSEETKSFVFGSYIAPSMTKRLRQSQQDGISSNGLLGRKESVGKKVQRLNSLDAPPSPVNALMFSFLDDVLNRHALHLLEDCSIQDLGAFAAYLEFDLVRWLQMQQHNVAQISDFALALMRLHTQFKWPYPLVSQSIMEQLSKRIEGIKISASNRSLKNKKELVCAQSAVSTPSAECISNSGSDWEGFQKICGEIAARGTQESELELKYMLDMMYEAGYANWTFLLCLLRRDVSFLRKHFTREFVQNCGSHAVDELLKGLEQLEIWAVSSWYKNSFGYRALIDAYKRHILMIGETNESGAGYSFILDSHIALNGTIPKNYSVQSQPVPTLAAMELVKRTFTPPREKDEVNGECVERDRSSIVSNTTVADHEQCLLM